MNGSIRNRILILSAGFFIVFMLCPISERVAFAETNTTTIAEMTENKKADTVAAADISADTTKSDTVKSDTVNSDTAKSDAAASGVAATDTAATESGKDDTKKSDTAASGTVTSDTAKEDSVKEDAAKSDAATAENGKSDSSSAGAVVPETVTTNPADTAGAATSQEDSVLPQTAGNGWVSNQGNTYYYENGQTREGWLVVTSSPSGADYGIQRYWLGTGGILAVNKLIDEAEAGYYAFARPEGFVVRGKYINSDGNVYLANNDGKLEQEGWLVTDDYDGGWQRYYIDDTTRAAKTGLFTVDNEDYYGIKETGYELRQPAKIAGDLYYADNDGVLLKDGWLVTSAYGQGLQRYWFADGKAAGEGLYTTDKAIKTYVRSEGYVVRGKYLASSGIVYLANNDGVLETPGWLVTDKYDGGWQRYYIDAATNGASIGFFTVDGKSYYGIPNEGYELRSPSNIDGSVVYADNSGALFQNGWLVTSELGQGLQRYWFVDGKRSTEGLYTTDANGDKTYTRAEGYVVRGKYRASSGIYYLANNDGKLETPGWLVTTAYDGEWRRYYIDKDENGAVPGFFKVGEDEYYNMPGSGYTLCEKFGFGDQGVLLADSAGVLAKVTESGWLVTGLYDNGDLERYRIEICCGKHAGARIGSFSVDGKLYYGIPDRGYELRNQTVYVDGKWYSADNDGVLSSYATPGEMAALNAANGVISQAGASLRSVFNFIAGNYSYRAVFFMNPGSEPSGYTWAQWRAEDMYSHGSGNCYSFACLFAVTAKQLGYSDIYVHNGMTTAARGGWTAHSWVTIGGGEYDPEMTHETGKDAFGSSPFSYQEGSTYAI